MIRCPHCGEYSTEQDAVDRDELAEAIQRGDANPDYGRSTFRESIETTLVKDGDHIGRAEVGER